MWAFVVLAAGALCPDLADLKFTRSQITEHRLNCPWFPLLGPQLPPPTTVFCNWVRLIVMHFFYICPLAATIDPKNLLADSFSFF